MKLQCSKPCHDCPFRSDIIPYQRMIDVQENLMAVTSANPEVHTACHHHSRQLSGTEQTDTRTVDESKRRAVTCGGFLVMRQKLGLALPRLNQPVKDVSYVFGSIKEFFLKGPSPNQAGMSRYLAWFLNQPRSKQIRLIAECRDKEEQEK